MIFKNFIESTIDIYIHSIFLFWFTGTILIGKKIHISKGFLMSHKNMTNNFPPVNLPHSALNQNKELFPQLQRQQTAAYKINNFLSY